MIVVIACDKSENVSQALFKIIISAPNKTIDLKIFDQLMLTASGFDKLIIQCY
jgi:hypothetical protein